MTLRVLALLVAVAPKSSDLHLRSFLKKQALRQAHDENAVLRSAAVWSLAVVAPRQAAQLFASRDLVTLAALLRQAHDPELATAALAFADSTDQDSLDELAREAAWINPEMMSGASTSQLRMAMKFAQLRSVAALAKRYSSSPRRGSSPGLREVSSWLEDENPKVRAAAASALGASEDASTLGLLEQAYFREEDSKARRALVASLHRLAPGSPFLKRVSELDGDSGCRAHSLGRRDPGALGVAITQVKEKTSGPMIVTLQTRRGLQIRGMAAPDGFFAVAYEDL
jgi:hypothetical protein